MPGLQAHGLGTHPRRFTLPLAVLGAVLLAHYAVGRPDLLHLDVALTPAALGGAVAALVLCVSILVSPGLALSFLVAAVYVNLSNVLVRQGLPSILQLAAVPLFLAALISRAPDEWVHLARRPLTWMLLGYTLVLLGSTTYARVPDLGDARVADTGKALLIYLLIVLLASSVQRVRLAAWTMLLAGTLLAGLGVLSTLGVGIPGVLSGLARVERAHIYGTVFEPRITGPLGDANFFAQILLVLVPIGLFLARDSGQRRWRLIAYGSVALIGAGTVLTYSRGAALALAAVVPLALVAHGISWRRLMVGGAVLASLWTFALPSEFTTRLGTIRQFLPGAENVVEWDSSFQERLLLTGTAWTMFADNPVLGVGAGNYTARFAEYAERFGSAAPDYHDPGAARYPHNLLLEVGAETGAVGLTIFAAALIAAFAALGRVRTATAPPGAAGLRGLARAFQIALLGYMVSSLFLHGDFQRYLWLLLGMAGAMDALAARPRRARPAPSPSGSRDEAPAPDIAPGAAPGTRRGIGVLLSRFPSVTETFILREVIEMERQGQPVRLMPLLRESPPIVHREAEPWITRALFTPFLSRPIVVANLRALARHPGRYLTLVARLLLGTLHSPRVLIGTIGIIPKSVYLAERVRAEGIRHVHAHFATHPATAALIISAFADATFSITIHAHDLLSRRYRPLLPLKIRRASFVRVISRFNRDTLRALYPDTPIEKVHVVHVGIDPSSYWSEARADAVPTEAPAETRLLCVAALRDYKGLPVFLDACRRLGDQGVRVRCDVVGEGPMRPRLERMIRELGLERCVRLLGAQPQHEVHRLLAERPIFVLSSVVLRDGWMDGIPVALMEAMAAGTAIVASRISGIPELVEHGVSGLLVEPGDAAELAGAIRQLASAPEEARRLGEGGRAKVAARFRLNRCVSDLLALIDRHNPAPAPASVGTAAARLQGHAAGAPVGVRRVHEGRDAVAAELLVPTASGPPREWVLKIHRDHAAASLPAAERARHEWLVLGSLREIGVPRPVHGEPDEGWLVMERCAGEALGALLRAGRASPNGHRWRVVLAALHGTGGWLRRLQHHTREVGSAGAAHAAWRAAAEADIGRCQGTVRSGLLAAAGARLQEEPRGTTPAFRVGVLHHGDFGPGNVFVGPDRLEVIDFEGSRRGLPYEDVAYFVLQLELYFGSPLLNPRRRGAVSAFLAGYLGGEPLDEPAYRIVRISKALQILARTGEVRQGGLAAQRRHRTLCRMLERALA